jgi:hypothetical protein
VRCFARATLREAERLAVRMAEKIHGLATTETPVLVSVAGALWLIAAVAAARRGMAECLRGRRARIYLDLAWAQAQRKRDAEATLHLLDAECCAPEVIRYYT